MYNLLTIRSEEANVNRLMATCVKAGSRVVASIAHDALRRVLRNNKPSSIGGIFRFLSDAEMKKLGKVLTNTNATAHQLGRAAMRIRANHHIRHDKPTPFELFSERFGFALMEPTAAMNYFTNLIPNFKDDPDPEFSLNMERHGFTLAVTTDEIILNMVKRTIQRRLDTGENISTASDDIDSILTSAGISTDNPSYPEMVFRTNMMESYRHGHQKEFMDPDLDKDFPVWQYLGIPDGRERKGPSPNPNHHRWFDKYFPRKVSFFRVRGTGIEDVVNCRCMASPVYVLEWHHLQSKGETVTHIPGII